MGDRGGACRLLVGKIERKSCLEEPDVDVNITLMLILKK